MALPGIPTVNQIKDLSVVRILNVMRNVLMTRFYGTGGQAQKVMTFQDMYDGPLYAGNPDNNGAWKIEREGADLAFYRREDNAWVKKGAIGAS